MYKTDINYIRGLSQLTAFSSTINTQLGYLIFNLITNYEENRTLYFNITFNPFQLGFKILLQKFIQEINQFKKRYQRSYTCCPRTA